MGKRFNSILASFANGSQSPPAATADSGTTAKLPHGRRIRNMSPEERSHTLNLAHTALKDGLSVFMSKQTVQGFNRLLETTVTSRLMRRLLVEIAAGRLILTRPPTGNAAASRTATPSSTMTTVLPTVLSMDQLSAGIPFTLKQAARILNVDEGKLYYRCVIGRIHHTREKSRYYIPATEVQRLQVVGL